jgi:hypothetical protein
MDLILFLREKKKDCSNQFSKSALKKHKTRVLYTWNDTLVYRFAMIKRKWTVLGAASNIVHTWSKEKPHR